MRNERSRLVRLVLGFLTATITRRETKTMSIDQADYWMTPDEERKLEDKLAARRVHYLEANEYIVDGDESLNNGKWSKVSYGMIGHQVWKPEVGTFRRFDS